MKPSPKDDKVATMRPSLEDGKVLYEGVGR
jgi:hypothetical protein